MALSACGVGESQRLPPALRKGRPADVTQMHPISRWVWSWGLRRAEVTKRDQFRVHALCRPANSFCTGAVSGGWRASLCQTERRSHCLGAGYAS